MPSRRDAILHGFLLLVYVGSLVGLGWTKVHNHDIPLHILTGERILADGPIDRNIVSPIHQNHPMVDDKWLFQVGAAMAYQWGGFELISVIKGILVIGLGLVVFRLSHGARLWLRWACVGTAVVACSSRFMARPDLLSLLMFAAFLALIRAWRDQNRVSFLVWCVPLQVIWVNVHGYYILGPMIFGWLWGTHVVGWTGRANRGNSRTLLLIALAVFAACFVHPDGIRGGLSAIETLRDLAEHRDFYRSTILEFRPTWSEVPELTTDRVAYRAMIAGCLLFGIIAFRRIDLFSGGVLVLSFAISCSLIRNVPVFAIAAVWFLGWVGGSSRDARTNTFRLFPVALGLAGLLFSVWSGRLYGDHWPHRHIGMGLERKRVSDPRRGLVA